MVYVRQSSLDQVRHNHESRRRQYDLEARARSLGWPEVEVVYEDLGKSSAGSIERAFQRLVVAAGVGQVGAVFSIEVSRLLPSRSSNLLLPGEDPTHKGE